MVDFEGVEFFSVDVFEEGFSRYFYFVKRDEGNFRSVVVIENIMIIEFYGILVMVEIFSFLCLFLNIVDF